MKISKIQLKMRNTELTNRIALMATHGQQMITVLNELRSVIAEVRAENERLKDALGMSLAERTRVISDEEWSSTNEPERTGPAIGSKEWFESFEGRKP